jgi:hypothetical protein
MERQTKLLILPPEIWGSITEYLGAEHIGRFKLTGDKALWSRLSEPRSVKRLTFEFSEGGEDVWPGFVNELPSVEEIDVDGTGLPDWQSTCITLPMMPKTLRVLKSRFHNDDSFYFFHNSSDEAYSIEKYLPYLESLHTAQPITSSSKWQSHLPDSLTHLTVPEWCIDQLLPTSLTYLKVGYMNRSVDKPPVYPPQLVTFECLNLAFIPDALAALPTSLRKLSSSHSSFREFKASDVAKLPRKLKDLEIGWLSKSIFSLPRSASLIAWPPTLSRLIVNVLPMLLWQWLPTTLAILEIQNIPSNDLIPAYPADPSREGIFKVCFEDLPKSLTHLKVSLAETTLIHCSGASDASNAKGLFPPKLTFLDCENAQFSLEGAKQIPRSVTHLNILQLNSEVCGALPPNLKELLVSGCVFTPELIKNLPRSLTWLHMPKLDLDAMTIVEETGESAKYGDLVTRDPEKYGHKIEDLSMLWQGEYLLPSTLTRIVLPGHEYLDDRFVTSLPRFLDSCDVQSSIGITDLSIPVFSRHLTLLDLSDSRLVTSQSFKDLPRHLWWLSLASSKEIFDEHIKDLPRGLGVVCLHNAIHLTNSCVIDLPRSIQGLFIKQNRLITSASFPHFPPSAQSFSAAKWGIEQGEIVEYNEESDEDH